jgi:hypothetical protein
MCFCDLFTKNNGVLVRAGKILPTACLIYGVDMATSRHGVGDIHRKKKWQNETWGSVKWVMDGKLEGLENALVIWIGQVNGGGRNGNW